MSEPYTTFITAGRLGNHFFEAAAAFAYAKRHGLNFCVPSKTSNEFWSPIYLKHLQVDDYDNGIETINVTEKQFSYAPIPFRREWVNKNIVLYGYWQSEKHFIDFKDEMIEAFAVPWSHVPDVCGIHARFGDYRTIAGKHIMVDEPYLRKAMEHIAEKTGITRFKVFSDEIPHFQQTLGHIYNFEYSTNNDIWSDFIELSCMHSQINSSSTFSWWAAYLNKNPDKIIITQEKWFQDGWQDDHGIVDTSDIIPASWIKM